MSLFNKKAKTDTPVNPVSNAELAAQTANKRAQQQAEAARKRAEAEVNKAQQQEEAKKKAEAKANNSGGTTITNNGHSNSGKETINLTPKAEKKLIKQENKKALANTKEQQKIANDLADYMVLDYISEDVFYKLQENAEKGIPLPKRIPFKGSEAEKKFREQYMSEPEPETETETETAKTGSAKTGILSKIKNKIGNAAKTVEETENKIKQTIDEKVEEAKTGTAKTAKTAKADTSESTSTATSTPAKKDPEEKSANDYTYADLEKMFDGDPDKIDEWLVNNSEYEIGEKTRAALGEERIKKVEAGRAQKAEEAQKAEAAKREAERETKESANIEKAKDGLTEGTEGEINATADVLQEKLDDKSKEYIKKWNNIIKSYTDNDIEDYFEEGAPKGAIQMYNSGELGLTKKQAQDELDKLHEGEITWSKKRRDYLLKHPELANKKERKIINNYKKAKAALGYFALDAIATGLNNISKSIKGDTDLDLSMSQKMNQTNLEKAIERRNEKYGTSQQNQWKTLVDSMDLSKEAKQKLQDVKIGRGLQKKIAKLDNETQKQTLDLMASWDFTPQKVAKIVAAKEMINDDPDAAEAIIASIAGNLFDDKDGTTLDEKKVETLAKIFGISAENVVGGLVKGGIDVVSSIIGKYLPKARAFGKK